MKLQHLHLRMPLNQGQRLQMFMLAIQWQRLRTRLPDLFAILLLIALPPLVFWQVWTPNPSDRVMFGGDILMGAYPTRVFVHRLFELGTMPLWNPYQLGGMPLLGDVQVAPYYLPNLLFDLLYRGYDLPYIAFELLVVAHYALGGLFLFAYLRRLDVGVAAALVGAIGFEFNGFFVGHRGHYNMLAVAVWLPGVLWLLDCAWFAKTPRRATAWAVAAGLALSQMVMAGHPQATLYCALTVIAYFFYRWIGQLRQGATKTWRDRLRIPLLFTLAGVIAAGLAAIALLPALELLDRSLRNNPTYSFVAQFSLLPRNLIGLLMPEFLGWSGTEFRIYAGILTLVLAVVAWIVPSKARSERLFWGIAVLVALMTALGGFTILHGLVYRFVPGFTSIRVSTRAFFIANLALSILAAFGVESLLKTLAAKELRRLQTLVRGAGILLAVVVLLGTGLYVFLLRSYQPVGEDFFFAENLFNRRPASDPFILFTQTANAYLIFVLLLAAATALLWARANERLRGGGLAAAAALLMFLDVATFAPYHDTMKADPETARFAIQNYGTKLLDARWKIEDQNQLIGQLSRLPDGLRIDNKAEILPDNYSAVYQTPFATGYNILDLQERFQLLNQWPKLTPTMHHDLLNVGYVLTAPDAEEAPEPTAKLLLANSQGKLWQRVPQPSYAHFSTALRPAVTSITINGLLNATQSLDVQPTISMADEQLQPTLRALWPEMLDPALYQIGTTNTRSPVDLTVLAGGGVKYSAVIVDGITVTPEQRGIVVALISAQDGTVLNAGAFDTYLAESESNRLATLINAAPAGTIVALATYDEGIAKLNAATRSAFASVGASLDLSGKVGAAYAFIGVKGSAPGTALEQFDQTAAVLLDVGVGALPPQPDPHFSSKLLIYQPDQIRLLVQNDVRGLLTISEAIYPGWQAYVDGASTPILRANGLQRAIILPPMQNGQPHEVTFIFQPLSVRVGSALSLFTLTIVGALLFAIAAAAVRPLFSQPPATGVVGVGTV